jgi:hypothetical protein
LMPRHSVIWAITSTVKRMKRKNVIAKTAQATHTSGTRSLGFAPATWKERRAANMFEADGLTDEGEDNFVGWEENEPEGV